MKSVILDLDEDLTDEQIDKIIEKLQARKKKIKEKTLKFSFSKEEKQLIQKLNKLTGETYNPDDYLEFNNDPKIAINDFIADLEVSIEHLIEEYESDIGYAEDTIEDHKEEIEQCQDVIKTNLEDIEGHKKNKKEVQEGLKLLNKLEKALKNKEVIEVNG